MGLGERISMREDAWLPRSIVYRLNVTITNDGIKFVYDLIDVGFREWKEDLIFNTFPVDVANTIMQIPMSRTTSKDLQVWLGEPT